MTRRWRAWLVALGLGAAATDVVAQPPAPGARTRVVVLTDIEADPDDAQSLVRLLLYANDLDIEGLIATTSTHQRARVAPETIHAILGAYGAAHASLRAHDRRYPTAAALRAVVKRGRPVYGMQGVGEGRDSEGSAWLVRVLERPDPRPVWVSVWGGPNVLAQALWTIQRTRSPARAEALYRKLRVHTISDQDDSALWIRRTFPSVFYVVSPGSYATATWSAINRAFPGANNDVIGNRWLAEHVQQGHGPLGAAYPDVAYGMEGDTPAFLGLIPNGLNVPERPDWGGWGGRYELYLPAPTPPSPTLVAGPEATVPVPEPRPIWTNAEDAFSPIVAGAIGRAARQDTAVYRGNHVTLWRWREDVQHDFAARMDWTVKGPRQANHPPVPRLATPDSFTVRSGDVFALDASGTTDPDGDSMSYFWLQYPEAGTYRGRVSFAPLSPNLYDVHTVRAPPVDAPQTIHFILRVTDKGTPALTRYKRVVVRVVPRQGASP